MNSICFSATASFTAGVALLAVGVVAIRRTDAVHEVPYAVIPMIFGVQQLVEGGLWLGLSAQTPAAHALIVAYLAFANVLWPIYVPIAVWMLEPPRARVWIFLFPVAVGAAISLFFLIPLITQPVWAEIMGGHIKYHLPHPHHTIAFVVYFVATGLAPLLSSHRMVRLFGVALIVSSIATRIIYATWFASVWCFFAALMSGIVLLHFSSRRPPSINGSSASRA